MEKPIMFILENCPYCIRALACLKELKTKDRYSAIEFDVFDEVKESALASTYDYYYVPSIFYSGKKLHEGVLDMEQLILILDDVLGHE